MSARGRVLLGMALVLCGFAGARPARAEGAAACIQAHTAGQELRLAGKWHEARLRFQACAQSSCPAPIASDCSRWTAELVARIPTVILSVVGPDGSDTVDVHLSIDGMAVSDPLPATAMDLDPGPHVLRFEHAGWSAVEEHVVVREGEADRRLLVRFAPSRAAPVLVEVPPASRRVSILGVTMLAVGGVAAAVAIPFGVVGKTHEDTLAGESCGRAGTCSPSDVDAIRRDYWTAGVAAGVSAVALAIGIWRVAAGGPSAPAAVSADARGVALHF